MPFESQDTYDYHEVRLKDYDLTAAFYYNRPVMFEDKEYTLDMIKEVLYKQKPDVEDESCEWIVKLQDDSYAYIKGSRDYTGWH